MENDGPSTLTLKSNYTLTKFPDLPKESTLEYWKNLKFGFKKGEALITITTIPVAEGRTSYAFRVFDETRKMKLIGKIDKEVYDGQYMKDAETALDRLNTQRYSIQMARFWRQMCQEFNGPPIFFLPPTIY